MQEMLSRGCARRTGEPTAPGVIALRVSRKRLLRCMASFFVYPICTPNPGGQSWACECHLLLSSLLCHQAAHKEAQPPPADSLLPNSICTVQVYHRVPTAGLRGTVTRTVVQRTHCGAASVAKLEPDFYSLISAHGTPTYRFVYPAQCDSDMARSLRYQLGFGQGQLPDRACNECNKAYLAARKKRDDTAGEDIPSGFLGSLAAAAAGAAHALLGGGGGPAPTVAASVQVAPGPTLGMKTPVMCNTSFQRRVQSSHLASVRKASNDDFPVASFPGLMRALVSPVKSPPQPLRSSRGGIRTYILAT